MHDISFISPELMPWFMLLVAGLGIFIWRILGVTLSSKIDKDGLFAKWINAVAFAMTTGLMVRIIFFPTGALAQTKMLERLIPFVIGVIVFLCFPKKPIMGLLVGVIVFLCFPKKPIIGLLIGVSAFSTTILYNQHF